VSLALQRCPQKLETFIMRLLQYILGRTPKTPFQILSDLHLEVGKQYEDFKIVPFAPYLVLAGDIGRLSDYAAFLSFLEVQCHQFQLVFLVLGNHEFYGSTHEQGLELAKKLESEPQLEGKMVLLHKRRFDVPHSSIIILGCSLWSQIPDTASKIVETKVNDFKKIEDWTVESHNAAHAAELEWLKTEVESIQQHNGTTSKKASPAEAKRTILIITHHAPSIELTSEPHLIGSPWNSAFATDLLTDAEEWSDVQTWVFGHTHYSTEFSKSGVKVISNQRGYVLPGAQMKVPDGCGKGKWKVFDVGKVIKI